MEDEQKTIVQPGDEDVEGHGSTQPEGSRAEDQDEDVEGHGGGFTYTKGR